MTSENTLNMKDNSEFMAFCNENHLNIEAGNPQWEAVNADRNTVVSAGAGTGKTTVLSFRFLRLVAEKKAKPSEILTITFTRKATAEMKSRIYQLMQESYKKGLITEDDLKDFSNCTISTVDSFCSSIVRKNSVSMGVSRDFGMLSDEEFYEMSDSIVNDLLKEFPFYLKTLSVSEVCKIFRDFAVKCINFAEPFNEKKQLEKIAEYLEERRKKAATEVRYAIEQILPELDLDRNRMEAFERLKTVSATCDDSTVYLLGQNWDIVSHLRKDKGLHNIIKDNVNRVIPTCVRGLLNLPTAENLYEMARRYETILKRKKLEAGLLTFSDIMQLTLRILTDDIKQRQFYKNAFKYIMIDEFQDNNDDYRKLIFLLSEKTESNNPCIPGIGDLEPNKIFLVGDQKQSIYRFRGAEVDVFKRLSNELCEKPIELTKNWRSEPGIIDFCNRVFGRVMSNPDKKDYEADFSPLKSRDNKIEDCHIAILEPEICYNYDENKEPEETEDSEKSSKQQDRSAEAKAVAGFIEKICDPNNRGAYKVYDEETKSCRVARYSDIGLLFRSTTHQGLFESALNERQIPYTVVEPKTLFNEAIANDFYCAIMTALNPEDSIARASLLKSPFFSLKDKDIPKAIADNVDKDFTEILSRKIKTEGLTSSLSWLWNECGYRSFVLSSKSTVSYTQHFDWLYSMAAGYEQDGRTVTEFTDLLRNAKTDSDTDVPQQAVFSEETQGVQIMTIHKSKGLAFNIVIVCCCDAYSSYGGFTSGNFNQNGLISMRYSSDTVNKPENPVLSLCSELEGNKEKAELKRLFYVAATRPKAHLIFSVNSFDRIRETSILYYLLDNFIIPQGVEHLIENIEERSESGNRKVADKTLFTPKLPEPIEKVSATSLESQDSEDTENSEKLPPIESDPIIDRYGLSSKFGTRVHLIIQCSLENSDVPEPDYPEEVSSDEVTILEKDARLLADGYIKSRNPNAEARCEVPLVLFDKENNRMIEGRIDLLETENSNVTIVDFKTDRYRSPDKHSVQLGLYKKALSLMPRYKDCTISTRLVYLRDLRDLQC